MSHNKSGRDDAQSKQPCVLSEEECGLVGGGVLGLMAVASSASIARRGTYAVYTGGSNSGGAAQHSGFPTLGDMVSKTYFCA